MKLVYLSIFTLALSVSQSANAQGFLDSLNDMVSTIDETISSSERAQHTIKRVTDKIPEGEEADQAEQAPAEPAQIEPASGELTAEQEAEILERARQIEEERILKQAEEIRKAREAAQ